MQVIHFVRVILMRIESATAEEEFDVSYDVYFASDTFCEADIYEDCESVTAEEEFDVSEDVYSESLEGDITEAEVYTAARALKN